MSCIFIIAPMVIVGWPLLCAAVTEAAGTLGYKARTREHVGEAEQETESWVDIPLEDSQVIADTMARESEFAIRKDDVTATFSRAADGRCTVHVSGQNKTDRELSEIGKELVGRVTQQYAYNRVLTELKSLGFTVTAEEVTNDQAIRIHVTKYV